MPNGHVSVTVDNDLLQMKESENEQWQRWYIYKLPPSVTNEKEKAYTPQVVSLGPYHCKNQNLVPMKTHKDRALQHFLKRSEVTHEQCLKSLSEIVTDLMDAYNSLDDEFLGNPDAFLKLMILDGCFMLEIFRAMKEIIEDYAANDAIFSEHGKLYFMPHIRRDMLMLENQIPMKVLHKLYQLQHVKEVDANELVYNFLFPNKNTTRVPSDSLHMLDMHRKCIIGQKPRKGMLEPNSGKGMLGQNPGNKKKTGTQEVKHDGQENKNSDSEGNCFQNFLHGIGEEEAIVDDIIRSAVELREAGIKIKRSPTTSLTDIKFDGGILRLPMITVDDQTEALFLNLIAFERFHAGAGNQVTDYVYFMDNIIDDAPDIRLLHTRDIIQKGIGSDKAAAKLFNSLSRDVVIDKNSPLGIVYRKVNAYCKQKIHKHRADFCHKYFTSPWASISVFAAFVLFALTMTQTVYTVLSYYTKNN